MSTTTSRDNKCRGRTKAGHPCKRNKLPDQQFCNQHLNSGDVNTAKANHVQKCQVAKCSVAKVGTVDIDGIEYVFCGTHLPKAQKIVRDQSTEDAVELDSTPKMIYVSLKRKEPAPYMSAHRLLAIGCQCGTCGRAAVTESGGHFYCKYHTKSCDLDISPKKPVWAAAATAGDKYPMWESLYGVSKESQARATRFRDVILDADVSQKLDESTWAYPWQSSGDGEGQTEKGPKDKKRRIAKADARVGDGVTPFPSSDTPLPGSAVDSGGMGDVPPTSIGRPYKIAG